MEFNDVFLSTRDLDKKWADQLERALAARSVVSVFLSTSDRSQGFAKVADKDHVSSSKVFVVCVGAEHASGSCLQHSEIQLALAKQKADEARNLPPEQRQKQTWVKFPGATDESVNSYIELYPRLDFTDVAAFDLRGEAGISKQRMNSFAAQLEEVVIARRDAEVPAVKEKFATEHSAPAADKPAPAPSKASAKAANDLLDWELGLIAPLSRGPIAPVGQSSDFASFTSAVLARAYITLDGEGLSRTYSRNKAGAMTRAMRPNDDGVGPQHVFPLPEWLAAGGPRHKIFLGPAGAGKSTFLQRVAGIAARCCQSGGAASRDELGLEARTLARDVDGETVWPIPYWIEAQKFAAEMQAKLASLDANDPRTVEVFEEALKARLPQKAQEAFFDRIMQRPYVLFVDGLDQVASDLREIFTASLWNFAARHSESQLSIIGAARAARAVEAARHSSTLASIAMGGVRDWEAILIRPLTAQQIRGFCEALPGALQVPAGVENRFAAVLEDIAARSELKAYVETPFMLTLASFQARRGERSSSLMGPALIYSLMDSVFRNGAGKEEPHLRRALGAVAAQLVKSSALDMSTTEFVEFSVNALPDKDRAAWAAGRGEAAFDLMLSGAFGFLREGDPMSGGHGANAEERQGRFVHGLFRDVMAADYLVAICKASGWEQQFETLQIWEDIAENGKRWREPVRILLTAFAIDPSNNRAGKAILAALRKQAAAAADNDAKGAILSLLLSPPPENFSQLADDAGEAVDELERAYLAIRGDLVPSDREAMYSRLVTLISSLRKNYPPGAHLFTAFNIGEGEERFVRIANSPVAISEYRRFLKEVNDLGEEAIRLYFAHVPDNLDTSDFLNFNKQPVDVATPLDFLIDRHSPEFWREQVLRRPGHPVVGVNWVEAVAFCAWLAEKIDYDDEQYNLGIELGPATQLRLPTRAEWAAIGRQIANGDRFIWGPDEPGEGKDATINWRMTRLGQTSTIGLFPPQGGLYDFAGNVREWGWPGDDADRKLLRRYPHLVDLLGGSYRSHWDTMRPEQDIARETILEVSPAIGFRWIVAPPLN